MVKRPKIGLAFSGGAARGFSYIGILKVLEKHEIPIDYISGTSAGAIVGALYASGHTPKEIEMIVTSTKWIELFDMGDFSFGLIGQTRIQKYLKELFQGKQFKDLRIPMSITAVDIDKGIEVIFDSGDVARAVDASMSIPGLFAPVRINGSFYVDGGVIDPIPVGVLKKKGMDLIVAVDLCVDVNKKFKYKHVPKEKRNNLIFDQILINGMNNFKDFLKGYKGVPNFLLWFFRPKKILKRVHKPAPPIFEIASKSFLILQNELTRAKLVEHKPDIIIKPNVSDVGMFDFHKAKKCIKRGESATIRHISTIKKLAKIK